MLGTAYIVDHTCYTLCIRYVSRGIYKVRNKSWLNDISMVKALYLGVGVHTYPHIRIEFIGFPKCCAMIAL